jgi:predicted nucleic acid-binding protein
LVLCALLQFIITCLALPYFELRRKGITIRSNIDCAIAIIAIENNFILYHVDRDFEMIAKHTVLKQQRINW